jgi:DNA-binding IclR family transcriptional regulator
MRVDGGFRMGPGFLALARRAYGDWNVAKIARPFMEQLSASLGESVCVGRIEGASVRIEACVEGGGDMRIALKPGIVLPRFAGSVGKVVLAGLSPEEAKAALPVEGLPRFTEQSVTDPVLFLQEVERCRSLGYADDDQEYLHGVRAVAAPIEQGGKTVAVLWVVGLAMTLTSEAIEPAASELVRVSRAISSLIGPKRIEKTPTM